jgi:hypothetical protein
MKFIKDVFDCEIYGENYKLSKPTVDQVERFSKSKKSETIEGTKDFLAELGLPKTVTGGMQVEHLKEVVENLVGGGKK